MKTLEEAYKEYAEEGTVYYCDGDKEEIRRVENERKNIEIYEGLWQHFNERRIY